MKYLNTYINESFLRNIFESGESSNSKNVNKMLQTINKLDDNVPVLLYTYIPESCLKESSKNGKFIKHYGDLKNIEDDFWDKKIKRFEGFYIDQFDTDGQFINTEFLKNITDEMIVNNKIYDYHDKSDEMQKNIQKYPSIICIWGELKTGWESANGIMGEHTFVIHFNAKASKLLKKHLKEAEEVEALKKQKSEENKKAEEWNDDNKI